MISQTHIQRSGFAFLLAMTLLLGIVFSGQVFAAEKYRVSTQFISLGETIANPTLVVTEGETLGGTYSVKGDAEYKIVILLRKVADKEVSISLQFTSGTIDIQPNLTVELDKEISRTIDDKILMKLLVRKVPEEDKGTQTVASKT
jgi:hypothetical protein